VGFKVNSLGILRRAKARRSSPEVYDHSRFFARFCYLSYRFILVRISVQPNDLMSSEDFIVTLVGDEIDQVGKCAKWVW
jgi:hypothetical protein